MRSVLSLPACNFGAAVESFRLHAVSLKLVDAINDAQDKVAGELVSRRHPTSVRLLGVLQFFTGCKNLVM